MISPNQIENLKQRYKQYQIEYDAKFKLDFLNEVIKKFDKEIIYQIKKIGSKTEYKFTINLTRYASSYDGGPAEIALTRDIKLLNEVSDLFKTNLETHGWKNIKIKVCNPYWPFNPKYKMSIER